VHSRPHSLGAHAHIVGCCFVGRVPAHLLE
jgi:hypothetical protein